MRPLYTWRDVERLLDEEKEPPWFKVSADLEELRVVCASGQRQAVLKRLGVIFGAHLREPGELHLISTRDTPRRLRVVIDDSEEDFPPRPRIIRPLWPDAERSPGPIPRFPPGSPSLAAFYSYKGGVGRTTTLLGALGALLELRPPLATLVVDADLEAPGLTLDLTGPPDRFCLLDFLALVHDAEDWRDVIPLAAARLELNRHSLELSRGTRSFFFLPAYREREQLFDPPVSFEQVVRGRGRAHVIAEAFAALGMAVGANVVLVDLRAGVTELSSPLLLDPRVQAVLVTSCSHQSYQGTLQVLERMRTRARPETSPEVVLSLIPPSLPDEEIGELTGALKSAIPSAAGDEADEAARPNVHELKFAQELIHVDSVAELLRDRAPGTDLGKTVGPALAELLVRRDTPTGEASRSPETLHTQGLKAVASEAEKLEYAEGNAEPGLLVTPALAALVEQFPEVLPAAVVLGAKGAGKTFAWGQMVLARDWQGFAKLVEHADLQRRLPYRQPQAAVFPLLGPRNMRAELADKVRDAERGVWKAIQAHAPMGDDALHADLNRPLAPEADELHFWTGRIAARLGLPEQAGASVQELALALAGRNLSVCLAIDGLEEAFQPSPTRGLTEQQQRMLRGLLQRFTLTVRELGSPYLGVVTFVRRDLAQSAIPQNFLQFEALHSRFTLAWSPTEALRLVAWLLNRAGLHVIEDDRVPLAPYEDLRRALVRFWGEKMGSQHSREAATDRWVIAALSDFNGRLQARDLVRLVRHAAASLPGATTLSPKSLREALVDCSRKKIDELEREIPGLQPIFARLRSAGEEQRKIPFRASDFGLSPEEISFLEAQGVLTRAGQGELYLPEIIRHGLGFRMDRGRRAKVLALYRATQAKQA